MTSRLLSGDALGEGLGGAEPAGVSGDATAALLALDGVGQVEVGLWEMGVGSCRDVEVDEVFVVLAGRGVLTLGDGSRIELAPGVVVRLDAGEHTGWTVSEPLRKLYVAG